MNEQTNSERNASARCDLVPSVKTELELAMKASHVIAQANDLTDLTEVLRRLAHLIATNLPSAYCRILLAAPDGRSFRVKAAHATVPLDLRQGEALAAADLPDSERLHEAGVRLIGKHRDHLTQQRLAHYSRRLGLAGALHLLQLVPLLSGKRLVGVLELGELQPPATVLREEKLHATLIIAAQIALLIDCLQGVEATQPAGALTGPTANASFDEQLFKEKIAKLSERHLLNYLSEEFLRAALRSDALNRAVEVARALLQTDYASIVLSDENGDLYTAATAGWEDGIAGKHRPGNGLSSHTGFTLLQGAPVQVLDYVCEGRFTVPPIVREKGIKSGLSAPLTLANGVKGALVVQTLSPRNFNAEERHLLCLIANETSLAVELKTKEELVRAWDALVWIGMESIARRHELNSAAAGIRAGVQLIKEIARKSCLGLPDKLLQALTRIESHAVEISRKPLSKFYLGTGEAEVVCLNQFICARLDTLWQQEEYHRVSLETPPPETGDLAVRMQPELLRQALDILLDNAVAAAKEQVPERCLITVQTRQVGHEVEIAVLDRGGGIPRKVQAQLFKGPIEKPANSKGLGIGLLVVKAIAEKHGGKVYVHSTGADGTKMILRLPAVCDEDKAQDNTAAA